MLYSSTFLGQIRDRAMDLYQNSNVMPPLHIKQAMVEAGIPEEKFWETRQAIQKLGLVEKPPVHRRKRESSRSKKFLGNPFAQMRLPIGDRDPM